MKVMISATHLFSLVDRNKRCQGELGFDEEKRTLSLWNKNGNTWHDFYNVNPMETVDAYSMECEKIHPYFNQIIKELR